MTRIAISVEGQTEDEFCKQVLRPYLNNMEIDLIPIIVTTKRRKCGIKHKGGCINLQRVKSELEKLLPNFDYVTTFYDLYGFDISGAPTATELELIITNLFTTNSKLIPYIQQYEFETLLFSKASYYEEYFETNAKIDIEQIVASCNGVENINNSKETAPSKRINKIFDKYNEQYDKVFHGPLITDEIGLNAIRKECPRFEKWLTKIEALSS